MNIKHYLSMDNKFDKYDIAVVNFDQGTKQVRPANRFARQNLQQISPKIIR